MQARPWSLRILTLAALWLVGGSALAQSPLLESIPGSAPDQGAAVVTIEQEPKVLYLNAERRVAFRSDGSEIVLDEGVPALSREGGKHLRLYHRPEGLFATWWQKRVDGAKDLFLRRSIDRGQHFEPVVKLNTEGGVLPTYLLVSDGDGRVAVAYHDERLPRYRIHVNVSHDAGATWLEQDIRLDSAEQPFAIEPQLVFQGERLIATWKERLPENMTRVVARVSEDGGLNWRPEQELGQFEGHFFTADALRELDGTVLLLGYVPGHGIIGYHSADGGDHWQALPPVPGTDRHNVAAASQIDTAQQDGYLHTVFTLELHGRDEARRSLSPQVFTARLDAESLTWQGTPQRLDVGRAHNMTSAMNPSIIATEHGVLVASWEDYRDIRPNVYLSWSVDQGESWAEPQPALPPGRYLAAYPRLGVEQDTVHLIYDRFYDDAYRRRGVYHASFPVRDDGLDLPEFATLSEEDKRQRLEQRVTEFWDLRVAGQHEQVYDFFDPGMRGRVERDGFVIGQRRIRFHESELQQAIILDNIAAVVTQGIAEVPSLTIEGEEFEMPPRQDQFAMEWVWIDDDWYVVFEGAAGARFLRY